jgi:hypothetical protein
MFSEYYRDVMSWLFCPGNTVLSVLSRGTCQADFSRPTCLGCLVPAGVSQMSCPDCSFPTVLSWLSCLGFPISVALSQLSCFPFPVTLSSCPGLSAVLSFLWCPGCNILTVLFACPIPAVLSPFHDLSQCPALSRLFCSGYPFRAILNQLPFPAVLPQHFCPQLFNTRCPVLAMSHSDHSFLSSLGCPVLAVLSQLS